MPLGRVDITFMSVVNAIALRTPLPVRRMCPKRYGTFNGTRKVATWVRDAAGLNVPSDMNAS
jgi:hypothetical protein